MEDGRPRPSHACPQLPHHSSIEVAVEPRPTKSELLIGRSRGRLLLLLLLLQLLLQQLLLL